MNPLLSSMCVAIAQAADPPAGAASSPALPAPPGPSKAEAMMKDPMGALTGMLEGVGNWLIKFGPGILLTLVLLFVAWIVARWARRMTIEALTRAKLDLTLAKFFGNLVKWTIVIFALITGAGVVGIPTASFAAIIGAAGLAIGLALQGNLGNLASGVLLLIFRPFKLGDVVIVAGQTGTIDGIDLFTTNLDTPDNRRIIIPNNAIFSGVIENQTHHKERKINFNVTVRADADIEKVRGVFKAALERVASGTAGAIAARPSDAILADLVGGQIWTLSIWSDARSVGRVREAALIAAKAAVDANDLIPRPPTSVVITRAG